jgi:hypothetical protein
MNSKLLLLLGLCFSGLYVVAQSEDLIYVKLDSWAKDERFDKLQIVTPFFVLQQDTIETLDMENMREPQKMPIVKPSGYNSYAYGFLFFRGIPNPQNEGYVNLLMVDLSELVPKLFIDRNNNYDFTDDGPAMNVPTPFNRKESVTIELKRTDNPHAGIALRLSRMDFSNKYSYKTLMNEYYEIYYKNRKFAGIEYCFREQRLNARQGIVRLADDSFRIALQDENNNGWYDEAGADKILTANYADTVFESKDPLRSMFISQNRNERIIEKNGKVFELITIDPAGQYITLHEIKDPLSNRLPSGKKAPNITYIDWQGHTLKLRKLRRYQVYIYYTGPNAKNFSADTATLRTLATEFGNTIKVVGFIDVNKSYELKIFGGYSNLNWTAAYKNKYVTQDLKIRGIPSSLWLGKRRRVKQYNLTPQQLLQELRKTKQM